MSTNFNTKIAHSKHKDDSPGCYMYIIQEELSHSIDFTPHIEKCVCGKNRKNCINYLMKGYDCSGLRYENGKFLRIPIGIHKKTDTYEVGLCPCQYKSGKKT
jgi:hypothetical protein